jgi:hypothetical protein
MGWLKVLNGNEEEKFFWHPSSPDEVRMAGEKFADYLKQGFIACMISGDGGTGVQITEFDREAEEIFMLGLADGG